MYSKAREVLHNEDFAITGLSFRLPQDISQESTLWEFLEHKINLSTEWPKDRLTVDSFKSHGVSDSPHCIQWLTLSNAYPKQSSMLAVLTSSRPTQGSSMLLSFPSRPKRQRQWIPSNDWPWRPPIMRSKTVRLPTCVFHLFRSCHDVDNVLLSPHSRHTCRVSSWQSHRCVLRDHVR